LVLGLAAILIVTAPAWFHHIAFQINKCLARSVQICTALCKVAGCSWQKTGNSTLRIPQGSFTSPPAHNNQQFAATDRLGMVSVREFIMTDHAHTTD
jgi:hypothetical protein